MVTDIVTGSFRGRHCDLKGRYVNTTLYSGLALDQRRPGKNVCMCRRFEINIQAPIVELQQRGVS